MIPTRWSTPRLLALLAALLLATACAGVDAVLGPPADRISHPGFDTSIYPGDAAMVELRIDVNVSRWPSPSSPGT